MRLGRPWQRMHCVCEAGVVSQRLHHQDRFAAFLWDFSGVAPLRADGKIDCKAAFWRRPPPFSGHFRTHGGLLFLCSLSAVRAPLRSRRCSTHHRPTQILSYLPELLQQAIPRRVAARVRLCRHALKQ